MLKVSAIKSDAHGGEDASNGKCETDEAPRVLPGVWIVPIDLELL
jgi:hypothetical protein